MPRESTLRLAAALLGLLGLAISIYITIAESGGGSAVCVAGGTGCKAVAESDFSELAGINVSVLGIFGYLSILATTAIRGDLGRAGGLLFSLIGVGFSAYLTYLELFVIDAICQWCVASAVVMTVLFVVCLLRAIGYLGEDPPQRSQAAVPDPDEQQA